jgi:hypothetical protein
MGRTKIERIVENCIKYQDKSVGASSKDAAPGFIQQFLEM